MIHPRTTYRYVVLSLALGVTLAACDQADPGSAGDYATMELATEAQASPVACANRTNNTVRKLMECVTLDAVRGHQAAFQAIADADGGTRAAGTPGYAASADYVAVQLGAAGWSVTRLPFSYDVPEGDLQQTAPFMAVYSTEALVGSGEGDVTTGVVPVDINLAPPQDNTSGCEAADFAGFPAGSIALIQRGACNFSVKAINAEAAGAVGVVIFNQGNTPDRENLFRGTLGGDNVVGIPVVSATFADGVALTEPGSVARLRVDNITITSENVIAEKAGQHGSTANVVMLGAHLDSVEEGPGINDNGSGSAALLEVAVQMAKVKPRNTVRFAWWGAEEAGLIGSETYVNSLSPTDLDAIAAYLNFDAIGSPNFVRFVYDGDGSESGVPGPAGSGEIEAFFAAFYAERGLASEPTPLTIGSDHLSFLNAGVPVGGVFAGATEIKSPEQAAVYGGVAGEQFDPCYHLACDTFDNVSLSVLDLNADAAAAAALTFGMSPTLGGARASAARHGRCFSPTMRS